ncbi:MAG TPA: hypothetical protein VMD29_17230 [Terracidiphilus sp.]|nr:hypothetical protein [Terracidiphilus sp.]
MKLLLALGFALASLTGTPATAQTTTPPFPVPKQNQPDQPAPKGKVVFSRSTDDNGNPTSAPASTAAQPQPAAAPTVADAERQAVTYTAFDLDVHLRPADHHIAVRAQFSVRNDGSAPLAHLPLQLSSSLNWEQIRIAGQNATFQVATLNSDVDHTGQLHEAAVPLATPLAPGATLQVDATYSGVIQPDAHRLLAIGTPQDVALHSDWDQIDTAFTGLRGFGNVVWYPVSSVPALLGDGARVFDEMDEHKLRLSGAHFRLRLTVEFPHGLPPTIAVVNGHPVNLTVTDSNSDEVAGAATAQTEPAILGFEAPSLFVAIRKPHQATNLTAWTLPDNDVNFQLWADAAAVVTPFLQTWLGQHPRAQLTLLDLPDRDDAPFETGALLATSLHDAPPTQLEDAMAHALTHAWMQSPRAWLSEGVAHFMGTLWIEHEQNRDKALSALESGRNALGLIEPASPGQGSGQPLAQASAPVYYRAKAAYVLWMLRDIAGDAALSAALRAYNPAADLSNQALAARSGPSQFERLLEQAGPRHDLNWFFADWIDADKGLPDLTITSVFSTAQQPGNWLVAVDVANSGYAAAEVPVTVRTAGATSVTQRLRVPARGAATVRVLVQDVPTEVQVNDGTVPETEASIHVTTINPPTPAPTIPQ